MSDRTPAVCREQPDGYSARVLRGLRCVVSLRCMLRGSGVCRHLARSPYSINRALHAVFMWHRRVAVRIQHGPGGLGAIHALDVDGAAGAGSDG